MARRVWTRRETLQGAAAAAATACAPGSTGGGDTAPTPGVVDTVVFIMLENRSFDHWFGARALLEGKAEDGLSPTMSNTRPDGVVVTPFATEDPCIHDPPHGWSASHRQWNEGNNDGFCTEYAASSGTDGSGVMGYQTRETIPISWALADAYTHCDRYFAAVMGPTWPNRIYAHAGSSEGMTSNTLPEEGLYTTPSLWTAAEAAGVGATYYYGDVPFIALLQGGYNPDRAKVMDDFFWDASHGQLSPIVWVDPAFAYNDNHPPKHPALGELFLASVYEALAASPQWSRMLVIVTYDEHGGFFDHVSPPTTDDERAADGFDQLGFRVPCMLIGPWVKQGVQSTVFNHASWLKLVCELNGIEPWNTRIAGSNSLAEVLDADRMASGIPLDPVTLPAFDFDESTLDEVCDGGNDVTSVALMQFADFALRRGYPVRLDRREIAAPFLAEQRRRGLIG